jgi:hypothetical protein
MNTKKKTTYNETQTHRRRNHKRKEKRKTDPADIRIGYNSLHG